MNLDCASGTDKTSQAAPSLHERLVASLQQVGRCGRVLVVPHRQSHIHFCASELTEEEKWIMRSCN